MEATHASFFSGVGGLDLGLERAGWRTVSFSEIDPYASSVLAERWPDVPNLGDIVGLSRSLLEPRGADTEPVWASDAGSQERDGRSDWHDAALWSGGFPCQDLSVAGKRAGFAGARSSLAFAFLDLVGRYRPRAVLLENVPGLLSSHAGRDFGTLLDTLGKLGYGWAYRVLDAQHFGVPQRRRRVFILALDASRGLGAECAAEVLSVGSRCDRHPATGHEAGPGAAERAVGGVDIARTVTGTSGKRHDEDIDTLIPFVASDRGRGWWTEGAGTLRAWGGDEGGGSEHLAVVGPSPDPGGVRAPDGLAGRLDDRPLANGLRASDGHHGYGSPRGDGGDNLVADSPKRAEPSGGNESLLPLGLDSHRYRCCGNGVVSSVAEWIGRRLLESL